MKCPCKGCITFAICVNSSTVGDALKKCQLVSNYIKGTKTAREVIKILKPRWYIEDPVKLHSQAIHVFNLVVKKKRKYYAGYKYE